jgi:hypothetical protein
MVRSSLQVGDYNGSSKHWTSSGQKFHAIMARRICNNFIGGQFLLLTYEFVALVLVIGE